MGMGNKHRIFVKKWMEVVVDIAEREKKRVLEKRSLSATASNSESKAGEEWQEHFDESTKTKYWYNATTGEFLWKPPPNYRPSDNNH
jgi:hypothetical protein